MIEGVCVFTMDGWMGKVGGIPEPYGMVVAVRSMPHAMDVTFRAGKQIEADARRKWSES